MTKQIERAYRNNRRRSWLLIAGVVAIAAVAIPLASGEALKTFTLNFEGGAQTKLVCTGEGTLVDVVVTNTAKSATLGSMRITVPVGAKITAAAKNGVTQLAAAPPTAFGTRVVIVDNLGLAKFSYVKLTVDVSASATGVVSATVKQSNNFNDAATTANLFSPQPDLTLTVQGCGTISGRIWNDQNENGSKQSFESAQFGAGVAQPWTVKLYKKANGSYSEFTGATLATDLSDGAYRFSKVPFGSDYAVCEAAPSGTWAQTTGAAIAAPSPCTALPKGFAFAFPSSSNVVDRDFGNVNTVTIDCAATGDAALNTIGTATSPTRYTVKVVGGTTCKEIAYILEAYAENATRVANFHPVTGGGAPTYVIEKLEWNFAGTDQPGEVLPTDRSLKYDDDTSNAPGLVPMPYCLKDPRISPWELGAVTTDVFPTVDQPDDNPDLGSQLATSCLLTSTEKAPTTGSFRREDWIFSSVDGYRLGP